VSARTLLSNFATPNLYHSPDRVEPLGASIELQSDELSRWLERATWGFVALGIVVRVCRYLLRFPLWGDESALAANFLDRGYLELLRPLDFQQVSPPLFVWIELTAVKLFGFNEYSLRLVPFLCGLASVVLFRHLAARLLRGVPLLLAVAIFSVAYYPLRHSAEVKQYASDLLVATCLLALAIEWWRNPGRVGWLWALAAVVPFVLALSHPAAFVAGGVSVALVPLVWRSGSQRAWVAFAAYNVAMLSAFAAVFFISTATQIAASTEEGIMKVYWAEAFPPVTKPIQFLVWLGAVHTGQMFAYPLGGADHGSGALTFGCWVVGVVFLARQKRGVVLALCLTPFVVTCVAAAMQRYPYGGFARTSQHLAPAICLLAGLGAARLIARIRHESMQRGALVAGTALLAIFATGQMIRDLSQPYRTEHDQRVREFARWFWSDKAIDAELVCARTDLEQGFFKQTYLWRGIAQYLCNQRIYSPRHQQGGRRPEWESVSTGHPLRCVVFSRPGLSRDEDSFSGWLAGMQSRFDWVGYEKNEFHKPHQHGPDIERIEVFEFVPRADLTNDSAPTNPQRRPQPRSHAN
jgi:hypothetical protein